MIVQSLLQCIFLFSTPYLFFVGAENGRKANCQIKVFFFAEINLYQHSWQVIGNIASVFCTILGVICCGYGALLVGLALGYSKDPLELEANSSRGEGNLVDTAHSHLLHTRQRWKAREVCSPTYSLLIGIAVLYGATAIAFIEKTIRINNLDMSAGPITAAGQLIPLVIRAYVLFLTVMALLKKSVVRFLPWILHQRSLTEAVRSINVDLQFFYLQSWRSSFSILFSPYPRFGTYSRRYNSPGTHQDRLSTELCENGDHDMELRQLHLGGTPSEGDGVQALRTPAEGAVVGGSVGAVH